MIDKQLRPRGVTSEAVLEAIARVPRHLFVPHLTAEEAYSDAALHIQCGQTISQPLMVGLMTQALELSGGEQVLEIGTGSGYQAAVLAELAAEVYTIERHAELSDSAAARLQQLRYDNVHLKVSDGTLGWPEAAPFDRVIVTAGADEIPESLLQQLAEGGLLVMPVGPPQQQHLQRLRKSGDRLIAEDLGPCRFVPLVPDGR